MALRTINIDTVLVRNALKVGSDDVFTLCTSDKINKWSRFKPVRDPDVGLNWPAGLNGKFGLNLPSDWEYLPVRGDVDYGRLDDFRGYEHDVELTGPVVYALASDVRIPNSNSAVITPTMDPNVNTGQWIFRRNEAPHNDVKILPEDLGIEGYYYGVKLTLGSNIYYKTTAATLSDPSGQVFSIDCTITNALEKIFTDFPVADYAGTVTWQLFISEYPHSAWSIIEPLNIIYLETAVYGSKSIIASGSFELRSWLIAADISGTSQIRTLVWAYNDTNPKEIYLFRPVGSAYPGVNAADLINGLFGDHWNWTAMSGGNDVTNDFSAWDDGVKVSLFPVVPNGGPEISSAAKFGLSGVNSYGEEVSITLRHEKGGAVSFEFRCDIFGVSIILSEVIQGGDIGSTTLRIRIRLDGAPHGDQPILIYDSPAETTLLCSSTQHFEIDGTMLLQSGQEYGDFTLNRALRAGDIIIIRIGNAI